MSEGPGADARRGPGLVRRSVYALAPSVVLLVVLELLLAALGLGEQERALPLSRGFDATARYVLPDEEHPGGFVTNIFDRLMPEITAPPKGDAVRVLLVGGSNTYGFPTSTLARLVEAAARLRGIPASFEILNLGRPGYGSERVAILLEQALVLEPDVVVIFSGHNEFVEGGFRLELDERIGTGWQADLAETFGALRTTRLLAELLREDVIGGRPVGEATSGDRPETWRGDLQAFTELTLEDTGLFLTAFERNLRGMVALCEDADVPVVLATPVSNDLTRPQQGGVVRSWEPDRKQSVNTRMDAAFRAIPERLHAAFRAPVAISEGDWHPAFIAAAPQAPRRKPRDEPVDEVPRLRALQGELADVSATEDPTGNSVDGAHWPDPRLWNEDVFVIVSAARELLVPDLTESERAQLEACRALYDSLVTDEPDLANARHDRGLVRLALGDARGGRADLRAATRLDRAPRKACVRIGEAIARVVADHPDVVALDVDARVRAACPDGLVAYEVMLDHCHLQPGARVAVMAMLAPALVEAAHRGR